MIEIAVRVKELAASNLNNLVEKAASPAKMLRLLQLELEESIIALAGDATRAERRGRDAAAQAKAQDKAAGDWQGKAKLALASEREDLARGALAEREKTQALAAQLREDAAAAKAEQAAIAEAIAGLEAKLAETRSRLEAELAANAAADSAAAPGATPAAAATRRAEALGDRIATLEKRIDFAQAAAGSGAKAASLDEELAALQREAKLSEELAALKKGMKKK